MTNKSKTCPKCKSEMVQGFLADFTQYGAHVGTWVEGSPKKTWTGVKLEMLRKFPVATFRCEECGYLESYARKEFKAK